MRTDTMIMTPPIVGVPCLSLRVSEIPSTCLVRTYCSTLNCLSHLMISGPNKRHRRKAVIAAMPVLKVIYLKTLNPNQNSFNG